jgi:hypothetical protein
MGIVLDPSKCSLSHPNEEILEDYALHRLSEELTAQLEEHLLICRICQDALAETDEFVAAIRIGVGHPVPDVIQTEPRWQDKFRSLFPLVAKMSLVPVVVVTVLGFLAIRQPSAENATPVAVNLTSFRGVSVLAPAPSGKPLQLNIQSPDLMPGTDYRVELVDATGGPIWKGTSTDSDGKLVVMMTKPLIGGVYWVRVYGAGSELLREFGLAAQ